MKQRHVEFFSIQYYVVAEKDSADRQSNSANIVMPRKLVVHWNFKKIIIFSKKTGILKADYFSFNVEKTVVEEIPIHKCTLEDKKKFYKPNKIYEGSFDLLFTELYCITSPEKLKLNGDEFGDVSSSIDIYF